MGSNAHLGGHHKVAILITCESLHIENPQYSTVLI